jgi:hypothetical protein
MSTANFPSSMNLANSKQSCITNCMPSFQRIRSDNSEYRSGDIIRLEVPTGRKGDHLHGADSFIEFKVKTNFTGGTGPAGAGVCLDGSAYSFFKSLRIYHGSNLLVSQQYANRCWSALYDIQCNSAERDADQICLGINPVNSVESKNIFGVDIESGDTYAFSFTLPVSLLGSLQDHSTPLGWMGASSIYLELEIEKPELCFTTRFSTAVTGVSGAVGVCTAPPVYTSMTLSDIYYNAKISQLGAEYDNLLLSAFQGRPIKIPAVEWKGEQKTISATNAFSDKFSFQYGSVNMLLWWITNQSTANGLPYLTNNYNSAITQRACGTLSNYFLTLNGSQFPTQPISAALNNANIGAGAQFMAVPYQQLLRTFNQNSDCNSGGILNYGLYSNNSTSLASDGNSKRFAAGLSLNRVDGSNEKYLSGTNTMGSNFVLNVNWEYALSTPHFLFCYIQHDVAFELIDGLLSVIA